MLLVTDVPHPTLQRLERKVAGVACLLTERCFALLFYAEPLPRHELLSQSAVLFWSQWFKNTSLWQQELT